MQDLADAVWYVAYGSNLDADRLQRYLARATDDRPPADVRAGTLGHRLFFAHESSVWTGGSAFVEPAPGTGETLTRLWLLGRSQFLSVLAQENGRRRIDAPDALFDLAPGDTLDVSPGRYGLALGCASPDTRPALTFTTPANPLPAPTRPADAYVDVIVAGLRRGHGLDEPTARSYVAHHVTR